MLSPARKTSKPNVTKRAPKASARSHARPVKRNGKISRNSRGVAVKQSSPAAAKRARSASTKRSILLVSKSNRQPTSAIRAKAAKVSPIRSASVKQYEAAVKLLYSHEFEKAKEAFEKVVTGFGDDKEVIERTKIHLRLCEQKIARKPPAPRTVDEHYNLAVALMNEGRYGESLDHLQKALKSNPRCDYVFYALAANQCRTGDLESGLANLQTAINLKPENRFLAQRDSDFEALKDDARFTSLVFPERASLTTH
jgi:tetratricopeptide (TPR) repeat protein